jgi:hypothetical protein
MRKTVVLAKLVPAGHRVSQTISHRGPQASGGLASPESLDNRDINGLEGGRGHPPNLVPDFGGAAGNTPELLVLLRLPDFVVPCKILS